MPAPRLEDDIQGFTRLGKLFSCEVPLAAEVAPLNCSSRREGD